MFKATEEMLGKIKPLLLSAPKPLPTSTVTGQTSEISTSSSQGQSTSSAVSESVVTKSVTAVSIALPNSVEDNTSNLALWIEVGRTKLFQSDKELLLSRGIPLTDKHINFAQALFKAQYPGVSGFLSTLLQYKPLPKKLTAGMQIIYCRSCHWVAAYKEDPSSDVEVYDSLFESADDIVTTVITNLFVASAIKVVPIQKQSTGSNNCGLFAIAVCMTLLLKQDPRQLLFDEDKMRLHLSECFEKKCLSAFPFIVQ